MELDEADAGHPGKVPVEGPDPGTMVGRNGRDQKVCKTETFSCSPCAFHPVVNTHPGLLGRKEKRQCRKNTTQRNVVPARSSPEDLDTNRSRKGDLAGIEQPSKMQRRRALS